MTRNDLRDSAFLIGSEGISRVLALFLTVFIARKLGVVEFGAYSTAVSFVFLFSVFIEIGLSTYVFREAAKNKEKTSHYIRNALAIQAILSILVGIAALFAAVILRYSLDTRNVILLLWIWIVGISLGRLIRVAFKAHQRMDLEAMVNIFENGVRFVLVLVALQLGYGVVGIAIASIISAILMVLLSLLIASGRYLRPTETLSPAFMVGLVRSAWPFALSIIANVLMYRLSTVILSVSEGNYAVGVFDASFRITMSLFFVPALICQVFFARMSQYATRDRSRFSATVLLLTRYVFLLMYPFLMSLFIFAPQIVSALYTEEFFPTVTVLRILVWANMFNAGTYVGVYTLNAAGYEKKVMQVMFLGVTAKTIVSIVLIAWTSYTGAAVAAVFSESILMLLLFYYVYRRAAIPQLGTLLAKTGGIAIVSFGGVLLGTLLHLNGFVTLGLFTGLLIVACGALGLVTKRDLSSFHRLVSWKKAYE